MARMRIQTHHPDGPAGGWSGPASYHPRGGGYQSIRHMQVALRWRYRSRARLPKDAMGAMRIVITAQGLDLWEKEGCSACTRQQLTWHTD